MDALQLIRRVPKYIFDLALGFGKLGRLFGLLCQSSSSSCSVFWFSRALSDTSGFPEWAYN